MTSNESDDTKTAVNRNLNPIQAMSVSQANSDSKLTSQIQIDITSTSGTQTKTVSLNQIPPNAVKLLLKSKLQLPKHPKTDCGNSLVTQSGQVPLSTVGALSKGGDNVGNDTRTVQLKTKPRKRKKQYIANVNTNVLLTVKPSKTLKGYSPVSTGKNHFGNLVPIFLKSASPVVNPVSNPGVSSEVKPELNRKGNSLGSTGKECLANLFSIHPKSANPVRTNPVIIPIGNSIVNSGINPSDNLKRNSSVSTEKECFGNLQSIYSKSANQVIINSEGNPIGNLVVNSEVNPKVDQKVNPGVNLVKIPIVNPAVNSGVGQVVTAIVNPKVNPVVNPAVNSGVNPAVNTVVNSVVNPTVHLGVNPAGNPAINPGVNPAVNPGVNPAVNSGVHPAVNPVVSPEVMKPSLVPFVITPAINPMAISVFNPIIITPQLLNSLLGNLPSAPSSVDNKLNSLGKRDLREVLPKEIVQKENNEQDMSGVVPECQKESEETESRSGANTLSIKKLDCENTSDVVIECKQEVEELEYRKETDILSIQHVQKLNDEDKTSNVREFKQESDVLESREEAEMLISENPEEEVMSSVVTEGKQEIGELEIKTEADPQSSSSAESNMETQSVQVCFKLVEEPDTAEEMMLDPEQVKSEPTLEEDKEAGQCKDSPVSQNNPTLTGINSIPGQNSPTLINSILSQNNLTLRGINSILGQNNLTLTGINSTLGQNNSTLAGINSTPGQNNPTLTGINSILGQNNMTLTGINSTQGQNNSTLAGINSTPGQNNPVLAGNNSILGQNNLTLTGINTTLGQNNSTLASFSSTKGQNNPVLSGINSTPGQNNPTLTGIISNLGQPGKMNVDLNSLLQDPKSQVSTGTSYSQLQNGQPILGTFTVPQMSILGLNGPLNQNMQMFPNTNSLLGQNNQNILGINGLQVYNIQTISDTNSLLGQNIQTPLDVNGPAGQNIQNTKENDKQKESGDSCPGKSKKPRKDSLFSVPEGKTIVVDPKLLPPTKTKQEREKKVNERLEVIGDKYYKCGICNETFSNAPHFEMHVRNHLHKTGDFTICAYCKKNFKKASIHRHMRTMHKLHVDSKRSAKESVYLTVVRKDETGVKVACVEKVARYQCTVCRKLFKKLSDLQRHNIGCFPIWFFCISCKYPVPESEPREAMPADKMCSRCRLNEEKQKKELTSCRLKEEKHKSALKVKSPHRNKMYKCEECGKFYRKDVYEDHLKSLHGQIKLYKCDICDKSYSTRASLGAHKTIHRKVVQL